MRATRLVLSPGSTRHSRKAILMCGIAGIYAFAPGAPPASRSELRSVRDQMERRGPDASGEWFSSDDRVAFGHRRLSIIDLSERAAQPMLSADRSLVITFNGEIYNYQALRDRLERSGAQFRTKSDTEVLLHLYATAGTDMVRELRGMFAFAIWDVRRRSVFLARDPYGIKPLYYSVSEGTLRFASLARALTAGGVSSRVDPAGQVGFFLWGSVPEPLTYYRDIRCLPAGCSFVVDERGASAPAPFFSVRDVWLNAGHEGTALEAGERDEQIRAALRESVRHHLVADVPVGVFLSGGIDSGALTGLMREQHSAPIAGTTLRFEEFSGQEDDEAPRAAEIAATYAIDHRVRTVTQREFTGDLSAIFGAMDQPSIDGINTWFVSKASAEQGQKVVVSGLGGDELFGGYTSFRDVPLIARLGGATPRASWLGSSLRRALSPVFARAGLHPKLAGAFELSGSLEDAYLLKRGLFMPWELSALLPGEVVSEGLQVLAELERNRGRLDLQGFAAVAVLEAERYMRNQLLRDTDWASMAHALEVRVPLVDAQLLKTVAPLLMHDTHDHPKHALATAPRVALPEAVLRRSKTGFSTPVQSWLESSAELTSWRRVELLRHRRCPWARRFAYAVADAFGGLLRGRSDAVTAVWP